MKQELTDKQIGEYDSYGNGKPHIKEGGMSWLWILIIGFIIGILLAR